MNEVKQEDSEKEVSKHTTIRQAGEWSIKQLYESLGLGKLEDADGETKELAKNWLDKLSEQCDKAEKEEDPVSYQRRLDEANERVKEIEQLCQSDKA
jgi:hypothetical protein